MKINFEKYMYDLHGHFEFQGVTKMLTFLFYNVCNSMRAVMMRRVSDASLWLSGCALTKSI